MYKRLFFIFCLSLFLMDANSQKFYLFVGTYTNQGSKGIYVYEFNAATGEAKWISNTDSVSNPSYLVVDSFGNFVYAVNENGGKVPGEVSAFYFDKKRGKLRFVNKQQTGGDHPCYIALTKNGKQVIVGNYTGGNFSVFPVHVDGSLKRRSQLIQHVGSGSNKQRQEKAHVHATVLSPNGDYLFVPDLGMDKVMIYPFNASRYTPVDTTKKSFAASDAGSGPRHFAFHPNGQYAYLMEELTGTVAAYQYHAGKLQFVQRISSHPEGYGGAIGSADIHVSPDGKFLYASNRGDANNIAIFSIAGDGKLVVKGFQSSLGKKPRNFMIDPTGNFLLVANQDTNNIVVFKRDKNTGLLEETGHQIEVPNPVCLKMVK